jgi:hypothetical protein
MKEDFLYSFKIIFVCDSSEDSNDFTVQFCKQFLKEEKVEGNNDTRIYSGKIFKEKLTINVEVQVFPTLFDFEFYWPVFLEATAIIFLSSNSENQTKSLLNL